MASQITSKDKFLAIVVLQIKSICHRKENYCFVEKESFFSKGWFEGWEGLEKAYELQESIPEYQEFLQRTSFVDGTWDDHDFGINDGASWNPYKDRVQER